MAAGGFGRAKNYGWFGRSFGVTCWFESMPELERKILRFWADIDYRCIENRFQLQSYGEVHLVQYCPILPRTDHFLGVSQLFHGTSKEQLRNKSWKSTSRKAKEQVVYNSARGTSRNKWGASGTGREQVVKSATNRKNRSESDLRSCEVT